MFLTSDARLLANYRFHDLAESHWREPSDALPPEKKPFKVLMREVDHLLETNYRRKYVLQPPRYEQMTISRERKLRTRK